MDLPVQFLAQEMEAKFPAQAAQLRHSLTIVTPLHADFLRHYAVYTVLVRSTGHPLVFYAAAAAGRPAHLLGTDPSCLVQLLHDDGGELETAAQALSYFELLVETTRPRRGLTRLLRAASDIPLRENLEGEALGNARAAIEALSGVVTPPRAEMRGRDWEITAWLARNDGVAEEYFTIGRNGELKQSTRKEPLALPLIVVF